MSGASKAALESFITHRSKSTDSSLIAAAAAAKAKVLSPRVQPNPPNWLQAPPANGMSKSESPVLLATLAVEEDTSDTVSTGGDRQMVTSDGRAVTESDDDLGDHSVNLVVLGEVDGKQFDRCHSPSQLVAKKLLEGEGTPDSKRLKLLLNQKATTGVLKSMSDVTCNRRARSASVEENEERPPSRTSKKNHLLLTPDEMDENQATVGSGRGKWAKELVAETYGAMGKSPPPDIQENKEYERRPIASEVFSRGDVIVMKRSESNEYSSLAAMAPSIASTATIASSGSRDDEPFSSRRSRFPYRFKHHTVNLLTGKSFSKH